MNPLTSISGANPLAGLPSQSAMGGGLPSLNGMADTGSGIGQGLGIGGQDSSNGSSGAGFAPIQPASNSQGASFGDTLRAMIIERPSASKAAAGDLTARFAAGENIDPHQIAITSAKAGVEIQMATRTISSAVSAVRTLFQMQI